LVKANASKSVGDLELGSATPAPLFWIVDVVTTLAKDPSVTDQQFQLLLRHLQVMIAILGVWRAARAGFDISLKSPARFIVTYRPRTSLSA
jgi:hypothetical protein